MSVRNAFVKSAYSTAASSRPVRPNKKEGSERRASGEAKDKPTKSKRQLEREAREAERAAQERALSELIDRSAHFLVLYDGHVIATFAREDDALLFEGELADLDRARGVGGAECAVFDRRGRRVGGYMISSGSMFAFVRDEDHDRKYSTKRPRHAA